MGSGSNSGTQITTTNQQIGGRGIGYSAPQNNANPNGNPINMQNGTVRLGPGDPGIPGRRQQQRQQELAQAATMMHAMQG